MEKKKIVIFSDSEILEMVSASLNYENKELGLKPTYWVGNNNCDGMDVSDKPKMPLCQY